MRFDQESIKNAFKDTGNAIADEYKKRTAPTSSQNWYSRAAEACEEVSGKE